MPHIVISLSYTFEAVLDSIIVSAITLPPIILLLCAFYSSYQLRKNLMEDIKINLAENYLSSIELTVFTTSNHERVSGRMVDISDKNSVKLKDETGNVFLIPWNTIEIISFKE